MTLEQLPHDFTPEQFMQLDKESLDQIPYQRRKWYCQCKKCDNGTYVRDYGITPYFFLDRNSKNSFVKTADYWSNLNRHIWLCNKHLKFVKRLAKIYGDEKAENKLFDSVLPSKGKLSEPLNEMNPIILIEKI